MNTFESLCKLDDNCHSSGILHRHPNQHIYFIIIFLTGCNVHASFQMNTGYNSRRYLPKTAVCAVTKTNYSFFIVPCVSYFFSSQRRSGCLIIKKARGSLTLTLSYLIIKPRSAGRISFKKIIFLYLDLMAVFESLMEQIQKHLFILLVISISFHFYPNQFGIANDSLT